MIDNAVAHYRHLREQDVRPSDALEHARLRYGIPADVLRRRIHGMVADSEATQAALATARSHLTGETFWEYDDADELAYVLRKLYNAVTGETL